MAHLGLDSAEHYLKYGASMGRNPGKNFDTKFYVSTYPEVSEMGINPLLHYVLHGREKGYKLKPDRSPDPLKEATQVINPMRVKLLSLGFTDEPLQELEKVASSHQNPIARAMAAREMAIWNFRLGTKEGLVKAQELLVIARRDAPDLEFRRKLRVIEMLCHYLLEEQAEGEECFEEAALSGEISPDVLLAWANLQETPEDRMVWINQSLERYGISPVTLLDDPDLPVYDRLTSAVELPVVEDGPKVTVLLAAYDAGEMLVTALRSLQEQTWRNLEVLVIDDCSPDDGATAGVAERFAKEDPRFRLIQMEKNGGAYVARNRGLDEATGEFVTIHDADDWSHPLKIETQVRFLQDNPDVMGCTSEQARSLEDLSFSKVRGTGQFIVFNTSSFLYRREPVREALGYWDTVRFGADNEFIRRMQVAFGKASFKKIPTGPLSFQREAESSITTDPVMGLGGAYFGVRKEYYDAHIRHHQDPANIKYTGNPDERPFPVPAMMRPGRKALLAEMRHFDLVVFGDFRGFTGEVPKVAAEVKALLDAGKKVGLVEAHSYDAKIDAAKGMCAEVRELANGDTCQILVYGDEAKANEIKHMSGAGLASRYMPVVHLHE
ncbi:glycosyltransferase family 2 protein [Shimia thalassica]|uniref:glycosyltransferase family 2 protein n=1 Tax=Shimia thalassica TaxID=1715693 RepID=UPI0026E2A4B0|nr:glycosyltransferase family A protein [Shimia thalassica]